MSSESTGEEKDGEREGGPSREEGKKGRMVQFVAVTLAGATMELLRSLLRVTLEGHLTPLTSAPNRGRTSGRVQGIAVIEFSGLFSYHPSCLLRSPSIRRALERSVIASRLHRSSVQLGEDAEPVFPEGQAVWVDSPRRPAPISSIARLSLFASCSTKGKPPWRVPRVASSTVAARPIVQDDSCVVSRCAKALRDP